MGKLISMGECLIDFIPDRQRASPKHTDAFLAKAGGAPANVAVCVAKLGGESCFLGKFGRDAFGEFLIQTLKDQKVKTDYCSFTDKAKTALAFVTLSDDGDRDFSFYRNPSADMLLEESDIKREWFERGDILHFCSVELIDAPVKKAHRKAIEYCKANGGTVSFDVNIRLPLWDDQAHCIAAIKEFLPFADIVKVSEDELETITETNQERSAVEIMFGYASSASLIFVTKGGGGVSVYDRTLAVISEPAVKVKAVDTTGAGDCFAGCVLYRILKSGSLSLGSMKETIRFACAGAAVNVTRHGAINAMPTFEEINSIINKI